MTVDFEESILKKAFGSFATGLTLVTTRQENGTPRGFTANSFTSVSLDPPLLLVCISKNAQSYSTFRDSKYFAVNVLSESQRSTAGLFSSQSSEKFKITKWKKGFKELPIIDSALSLAIRFGIKNVQKNAVMIIFIIFIMIFAVF